MEVLQTNTNIGATADASTDSSGPHLKHNTASGSHRFAKDTYLAEEAVLDTQANPLSNPYKQEVSLDAISPLRSGTTREAGGAGTERFWCLLLVHQYIFWIGLVLIMKKVGRFSRKQVAASKLVTRLLPFLGVFVMFWTIYSQMSVGFQNQGCQMNLNLSGQADDNTGGELPIAALQLFDTLAIMIVVPLLDQIVYPLIRIGTSGTRLCFLG